MVGADACPQQRWTRGIGGSPDIDDEPVGLVLGDEQFAEEKGGWVNTSACS